MDTQILNITAENGEATVRGKMILNEYHCGLDQYICLENALLSIMQHIEIDYKILSLSGKIIIKISDYNEQRFLKSFIDVLKKRINDIRWNMKDSGLELIERFIDAGKSAMSSF